MTVFFAPSIWRSMDPRTAGSVLASIHSNPTGEHVIWQPLWNDALIARSRSLLATQFLDSEADVMVIVDDDIVWNPGDFWKIVEGARETESIYCGPYVTRSTRPHFASRLYPDTQVDIKTSPIRTPFEIEYAATGFVAIHRKVFEAMLDAEFEDADGRHRIHKCTVGGSFPFWPFFGTFTLLGKDGKYHYLSEDWAFSERARQLGFKVWCDASIILEHMGWYPYTVLDIARADSDPGLPSTGTDTVEIAGTDRVTGNHLVDTLVRDLSAWAEERPGDIRRMMATATGYLAERWKYRPTGEQEEQWYQRHEVGLLYALDLANWHLDGGCPLRLAEAHSGRGIRWLDYGAGIGTLALAAAARGALATAWEPNATLRDFISHRADAHGLKLEIPDGAEPLTERYDVVSVWHVFEHVKAPEALLAFIRDRLLRPGGLLITQSDFHIDDLHPQHHEHPDWEGALREAGFEQAEPWVYRRRMEVPTLGEHEIELYGRDVAVAAGG